MAVVGISVAAVLGTSCDPTSRYRVLSFLFDGVPPPRMAEDTPGQGDARSATGIGARKVGFREHGPYAAKLCSACHESAASNTFVVPREQLCFRCHEFKLDKKYVHGPLASGGCTACHDPHSSKYRYFLLSESDTFCLRCHDRQAIDRVAAHAGIENECTSCHDAHMSDNKYLMK